MENDFLLDSYNFELPEDLIAQHPPEKREMSKLMRVDKASGERTEFVFSDIINLLQPDDLLVLNKTKVINARLFVERESGGKVEIFFLKEIEEGVWEVLTQSNSKLKVGEFLFFDGEKKAELLEIFENGTRLIKVINEKSVIAFLEREGVPPLPPYISREKYSPHSDSSVLAEDRERYQTVFAKEFGAVAAPTAGLHFSNELLEQLEEKGVKIAYLTLHVGYGTFQPVKSQDIRNHDMHFEEYELSEDCAELVRETKNKGNKVIAVGTTSGRTLESCFDEENLVMSQRGKTDIFIYPSFKFNVIDGIITNFHLPGSSLILFISALTGRENLLKAYNEAIEQKYRFYSYGDAMLIL